MTAVQADGISILLVDDHPIVRQGYRRVLENQSDFRVVAEADNAASAYGAFKTYAPDVVVMDISMPGPSGLEAIRNIRSRSPRARILVFSMHSEAVLVKGAFNAGASGYVTKSTEPAVLVQAIRSVARGERAMSDDVAQVLAFESLSPSGSILDQLGEREIEILRQLAGGSTTEQIACQSQHQHQDRPELSLSDQDQDRHANGRPARPARRRVRADQPLAGTMF